jgi:hypothetical protein
MLDIIYQKIADKTLSFWCKLNIIYDDMDKAIFNWIYIWYESLEVLWDIWYVYQKPVVIWIQDKTFMKVYSLNSCHYPWDVKKHNETLFSDKIIWHPVMIWDCLDWISNEYTKYEYIDSNKICNVWKDKRKPIESQTYDCIEFIYSLIK